MGGSLSEPCQTVLERLMSCSGRSSKGCFCAEVRYRVEVEKEDEVQTSICHCGNCKSESERGRLDAHWRILFSRS